MHVTCFYMGRSEQVAFLACQTVLSSYVPSHFFYTASIFAGHTMCPRGLVGKMWLRPHKSLIHLPPLNPRGTDSQQLL